MSDHDAACGPAPPPKPAPAEVLAALAAGNLRFLQGRPRHPRSGPSRRALAAGSDQGAYALATVLACSDSRVPVELIFDAGIMELFVVRVAGNVVDRATLASVEYGVLHAHTPLLVVLGHSGCGAVTAALARERGGPAPAEPAVRELLAGIAPAARAAMTGRPQAGREELVDLAVEQNVRRSLRGLFNASPALREAGAAGDFRAVGAVYDLAEGLVRWLDAAPPAGSVSRRPQAAGPAGPAGQGV